MEIEEEGSLSLGNLLEEKYELWNSKSNYENSVNIFTELDLEELCLGESSALLSSQNNDFVKETEQFIFMNEELTKKLCERRLMKERIASLLDGHQRVEKYKKMCDEFVQHHNEVTLLLKPEPVEKEKVLVPLPFDVLMKLSSLFRSESIFQHLCLFSQHQPVIKSGSDGSFYHLSFSLGDLPESRVIVSSSVM